MNGPQAFEEIPEMDDDTPRSLLVRLQAYAGSGTNPRALARPPAFPRESLPPPRPWAEMKLQLRCGGLCTKSVKQALRPSNVKRRRYSFLVIGNTGGDRNAMISPRRTRATKVSGTQK